MKYCKFSCIFFNIILLLLSFTCLCSYGAEIKNNDELKLKEPAYRLGTTDELERRFQTFDVLKPKENPVYAISVNKRAAQYSYADSNLRMLSNEISQEISMDKDKMFEEVSVLWDGAIRKSETIKFAIYKLSNPDANKPDDKIVKKIISPLTSITTLAGASMTNPIISTSAFLGGSLMDIFSKNEKDLNYKYTKVDDTDMIVLVRKIDDLQRSIINYYCSYIVDRNVLLMEEEILLKRKKQYDSMQKGSKEELLVADSFYRAALDKVSKARTKFLSSRAVLEQLVGYDALQKFENMYEENSEE